jgi:hypothetical protein
VFSLFTLDEYKEANELRWDKAGHQKQYRLEKMDRDIVDRAKAKLGLEHVEVLHPGPMYRLLRFYWFEKAGAIFPNASRPFPDDAIEVRTYPRTYRVAFFFKRAVAGVPRECVIEYPLSADMVGWLKTTGRWPKNSADALN